MLDDAKSSSMSTKFVRIETLARETNLPRLWLKQEADAGRLPHVLVGRSRMFNLDLVLKALAERSTMPARRDNMADPDKGSVG